ncbi:hypothetical protein CYY_010236, partial [Polysphondylium violaceum]
MVIPTIHDIGFEYPMNIAPPYKWYFSLEKWNGFIPNLLVQVNSTLWNVNYAYVNFKTVALELEPKNVTGLHESVYLAVNVYFPNGYSHTFNIMIPFINPMYQISSLAFLPLIQTTTNFFSLNLTVAKNDSIDLKLSVVLSNEIEIFLDPPVYGNPLKSIYRQVFGVLLGSSQVALFYAGLNVKEALYIKTLPVTPAFYSATNCQFWGTTVTPISDGSFMVILNSSNTDMARPIPLNLDFNYYNSFNSDPKFFDDGCYGIKGNFQNFVYEAVLVMSKFEGASSLTFNFQYYFGSKVNDNQYLLDMEAPQLTILSLEGIPGFLRYFSIKVSIKDNLSGFRMLQDSENKFPIFITSSHLIKGDLNDGVYETILEYPTMYSPIFTVTDYSSNSRAYGYGLITTDLRTKFPLCNPQEFYNMSPYTKSLISISSASWSHNNFDVSNSSFTTLFIVNLYTPENKVSGYIDLIDYKHLEKTRFYGEMNPEKNQIEIPVIIPLRAFSGVVNYIFTYINEFESGYLNQAFPSSQLNVVSNDADMMGPELVNLVTIISPNSISWEFQVYDRLNGFHSGNITIIGSKDQVEYTFTLDPVTSVQKISIPTTSPCVSQVFYISDIYLRDNGGYFSNMETAFINDPDIFKQRVMATCDASTDSEPPNLTKFHFTPSLLDVGLLNRDVAVTFTLTEDITGDGINIDKTIYVYLTSINSIIKSKAKFISATSTLYEANYECILQVPYGFGAGGLALFSIYGAVDRNGNFAGFSSIDLSSLGFDYELDTKFTLDAYPFIESNAEFSSYGGKLLLIGRAFGLNQNSVVIIDFNDGNGFSKTYNATLSSSTFIVIDGLKPTTQPFKVMVVKTDGSLGYSSNEYLVTPSFYPPFPPITDSSSSSTLTPTPPISSSSEGVPHTQPPNPCINDCGGSLQGHCSTTGCICYSPWMGIDCKSKVIIIPKPSINNTLPSTNISIPTDNSEKALFIGLISIVELQELDVNNMALYKYPFTQWIWSNISTNNEPVK